MGREGGRGGRRGEGRGRGEGGEGVVPDSEAGGLKVGSLLILKPCPGPCALRPACGPAEMQEGGGAPLNDKGEI